MIRMSDPDEVSSPVDVLVEVVKEVATGVAERSEAIVNAGMITEHEATANYFNVVRDRLGEAIKISRRIAPLGLGEWLLEVRVGLCRLRDALEPGQSQSSEKLRAICDDLLDLVEQIDDEESGSERC